MELAELVDIEPECFQVYEAELRWRRCVVPAVLSTVVFILPDFDREKRQIVDSKLLTIWCEDFDVASEPHLILTCSCDVRQQERLR